MLSLRNSGIDNPESVAYRKYFMKLYFLIYMYVYMYVCMYMLSHNVYFLWVTNKSFEYHYKVFGHWGRLRNDGIGDSLWYS